MTTLPQRIIALHASIGIVKAGESLTLQVDDDHLRRHGATRLDLFPGPPPLDVRAAARTLTPSASLLVSDQRIPTGYSGAITDEIRETLRQRAPVVTERDKAIAGIPRAEVVQ